MKIIADQNIPLVNEFFSDFGEVITLPGRQISSGDLKQADVLLVRSVTSVSADLLAESSVQFIGSCTIGFDHIDTDYLKQKNIHWVNAPGCNANAVVQYALSSMAALRPHWREQTIGIIGCGNIGGRLYAVLRALGVNCIAYDPFLSQTNSINLVNFEEVLQADIISCHTPLTHSGKHPTYHMLSKDMLRCLSANTLLINAGRGAMIDNNALLEELNHRDLSVALDVWENEPNINRALVDKVTLATPHIAGYSVEGKEQGTYRVYQSLCQFLKKPIDESKKSLLTNNTSIISLDQDKIFMEYKNLYEQFNAFLLACYDIRKDDRALKQNQSFDQLRKNYGARREYTHFDLPEKLYQTDLPHLLNILKNSPISE